ncbi:MAG: NAD(P)H-dependent glycerol-3-phosphate dehydrogenase, partial [Clostridiales Family XIII bacterium]|nr:NAD(P)H-dependent glycerol-3-phosphate dehydrogenase [Clostridiales Family XIII bacterium]
GDIRAAEYVQDVFTTDRFRVYTNSDVIGIELGGSLKNIIALGAGIADGMGYGDNTKAALMTRGITEMIRLGVRMGAHTDTFSGLSGIGDLIVTCTSMHSRNRRCGIMIGEGMDPKEAMDRIGMIVEGIFTVEAAVELAAKENVELPITESIYRVIKGEISPHAALANLMGRPARHEREAIES